MNTALKKGVIRLLHQVSRLAGARYEGLLILTYHRISEDVVADDPLQVSAATFARQMAFVKHHLHVISGEELAACVARRMPVPGRSCLITFDDGWADNYSRALPVLTGHGLPAVVFLSTDFVGTARVFWHENLRAYVDAEIRKAPRRRPGCRCGSGRSSTACGASRRPRGTRGFRRWWGA